MNGKQQSPSPALRWYRKTAIENGIKGLTVKGTERKRSPNAGNRQLQIQMRRDRGLLAWNIRTSRLRAMGLTTRGTPRVYSVRRGDAVLLRSQLDDLAAALAAIFHDLSGPAKARAITLEHSLADIRRQL